MSDDVDVKALTTEARKLAAASEAEYPEWAYVEASPREAALMMYRLREFVEQMADALEAVSVKPVPPADVKALVAEARAVVRDAGSYNFVPEPRLILELAAALEALSARPLMADREALNRVLSRFMTTVEIEQYIWESGVVQSKGDAQAEALEEAAEADADWTSSAWRSEEAETVVKLRKALRARAAAYRTPASPNEGNE